MKKFSLILSILIFITFVYFFVSNLINQLDLFYVMWGAILLPIPISLTLFPISSETKLLRIINMYSITLLLIVFVVSWYYPSYDTFDVMPDPGPRFIDLVLYASFVITVILSYISVIVNYSIFSKKQIITYAVMIPVFFLCLISFDKYRTLEYISAIALFILISHNYVSITYHNKSTK